MAELAVDLPVFIASPSDVSHERQIAREAVMALAGSAARHHLLVTPLLWESDARPGVGRPQDWINSELLKKSELVIVILSGRLGEGTIEELVRSTDQVFRGTSDDVLVYIQRSAAGDVKSFRDKLTTEKKYFLWEYDDVEDFRTGLVRHLDLWIDRWRLIPSICRATLQRLSPGVHQSEQFGEGRLLFIRTNFDYEREAALVSLLGRCAISLYQHAGVSGVDMPIAFPRDTRTELWKRFAGASDPDRVQSVRFAQMFGHLVLYPTPLRYDGGDVYFSDPEWFYFFSASGLVEAILANIVSAVEFKPYVNTVHQYLSVLSKRVRSQVLERLQQWLSNKDGVTDLRPIARNFAAYVLGMVDARQAETDLAEAAENDDGQGVRFYSITALGKLRSRRSLGLLQRLYETADDDLRLVIGQAVCRTIGIAQYEL